MEKEKEVQRNSDMEVLLMCKKTEIEHRIFCFEIKENSRLQFLQISHNEFSISLPSKGISAFLDALEFLSSRFQKHQQRQLDEGFIKEKELKIDDKVFCFEIGWMRRGHFLKVGEASTSGDKNTGIIIPSANNGWELFKKTLAEIQTTLRFFFPPIQRESFPAEYSADAKVGSIARPGAENSSASQSNVKPLKSRKGTIVESKMIRVGSKKFFFDLGSNNEGHFLKISEVMGPNRFSIIIPTSSLQQFHETVGYFLSYNDDSLTSTSNSKEFNVMKEGLASVEKK